MKTSATDPSVLPPDVLEQLSNLPDEPDTEDLPEASDESWSRAERGKYYLQRQDVAFVRIEGEVLAWLERQGGELDDTLNQVVRERMRADTA